jgi:hypothetical protein
MNREIREIREIRECCKQGDRRDQGENTFSFLDLLSR